MPIGERMPEALPGLSADERMQRVLRMLETRDSIQVSELAQLFTVSEVTVRSDLSELARQGRVARVRGGVRPLERGQSELGFDLRLRLETDRKQAIAVAAAAMVGDGEAVALDSSTTAYYLALELRKKSELVVVTNGLLIAAALADAPGVNVLVTGGMLRLQAMSVVGELGAGVFRTTRINTGFFGARGISAVCRRSRRGPPDGERVCFLLRVRTDRLPEYRQWHRAVWPEMLDALRDAGWRNYSLFLDDEGLLVGYLETEDFKAALRRMDEADVNARWQAGMAPFFELPAGARPDTGLTRLGEVFHLD